MELIDRSNLGTAYERQQLHTKVCLTKFMHNWLNTGYQKQIFHKDAVSDCPVCLATQETWQHIFQCTHDDSISIHLLALTQFKSDLINTTQHQ
eukprot:2047442-Ditylum_brightwellii.AAC.1